MNQQLLDQTVGQLVAEKPSRSRVFERWGIDYCCGGKRALAEACQSRKIDTEALLNELLESDSKPESPCVDWTTQPLGELCDHIVTVHHDYLRAALPRLSALTEKVGERHGPKDPRLVELSNLFAEFRSELESHMHKEEVILFPAIKRLDSPTAPFSIDGPIRVMLMEHDSAGFDLAKMRSLTDGFAIRDGCCNTHRAMLDGLSELELDMHEHIHKENNILFPRALASESAGH